MHNNLTYIAERLSNGVWLIDPSSYEALAKQIKAGVDKENSFLHRIVSALFKSQSNDELSQVGNQTAVDDGSDNLAIIDVCGVLMKGISGEGEGKFGLCSVDRISAELDAAMSDNSVKAICLNFNSPGGEVLGIEVLARKIAAINQTKPVIGWTETQSCSAAYWLMSQCEVIGMSPDARVGSVGVALIVPDASKKLEQEGIKLQFLQVGKYKTMGHPAKPLSDEEKTILNTQIETIYRKFVAAVLSTRNIKEENFEGLVYTSQEALSKGFADFSSDALQDYLNSNDIVNMKKVKLNTTATATAPTAVAPSTIPVKAESEEPKHEDQPQHEEHADAADGDGEPEMKHVKASQHHMVACPHCEKEFIVEMDSQEHEEPKTESEDKEEKKEETGEIKHEATAQVPVEAQSYTGKRTMAELMGNVSQKKIDPFKAACEAALKDVRGFNLK